MSDMWIEDDLSDADYDPPRPDHGSSYSVEPKSDVYPNVRYPIGFMRHKPIVRVKAWTRPIVNGQ